MTTSQRPKDRMAEYVANRVGRLQARYRADRSDAVAALARLRRGVGRRPGEQIELFGLAFENPQSEEGPAGSLFDELALRGDEATREEEAAFTAITLFAMHQQSRRDASMHRRGYSFGRSARLLGRHSGNRDAVRQRFNALGTAATWDETVHHARGLIQQFRQHKIPLDYGQFAKDLFDLRGEDAERVRTAWGRDFYRTHHPKDDALDEGTSETDATADDALADNDD